MTFGRQVRLGNDPTGEPKYPAPAGIPVRESRHPEHIGGHRVALACQFTVAGPVLGETVMGHVLHLIEGARIEETKPKTRPTHSFSQPVRTRSND